MGVGIITLVTGGLINIQSSLVFHFRMPDIYRRDYLVLSQLLSISACWTASCGITAVFAWRSIWPYFFYFDIIIIASIIINEYAKQTCHPYDLALREGIIPLKRFKLNIKYCIITVPVISLGGKYLRWKYYFPLYWELPLFTGACPFSVWIGRKALGKDITRYGDGNPGSANVFRAGNVTLGIIALVLDIAKGIPFIWIAHYVLHLPFSNLLFIGICAILGHAFSPFLKFLGGKAIAVTFGVLIALPQAELLLLFAIFTLFGFLFIEQTPGWQ